jgi:ABC-type histidine transport system ATPase subunit
MNRPERILRLENIHKRYGDQEVLRGVSLELARGDIKVIIGPSGSGKSTLLHCINFLVSFEQGRVWLHEREIDPELIGEVHAVIRDLAAGGMTMALVTHEIGFAAALASEILFMENGVVLEQGPPGTILNDARLDRTREFCAKIARLHTGGREPNIS